MQKKYFNLPVNYEIAPFEDNRFTKVKIYVMHDGKNLNNSYFDINSIEKAKHTITNIPILAFVKKDTYNNKDFGGHDLEINISSDGELEFVYLEKPIGVIPETNNDYHYEIINDKTYVVVNGYIWNEYSQDALEIIKRDNSKSESMEINIDVGNFNDLDGTYHITDYSYLGLTLLGEDVKPAMVGCNASIINENQLFSQNYFEVVKELNEALKKYMVDEKDLQQSVSDIDVNDKTLTSTNLNKEESIFMEDEKKEFETSIDNSGTENDVKLSEENVQEKNIDAEFEVDNTSSTNDIQEDNNNTPNESDAIYTLNAEFIKLKEYCSKLEEEVISLRKFKADTLNEKSLADKEALFANFSIGLNEDEMRPVKEKINDLTLEQIKVNLNEIFTLKNLEALKLEKFSIKNDSNEVLIDLPKKEETNNRYAV